MWLGEGVGTLSPLLNMFGICQKAYKTCVLSSALQPTAITTVAAPTFSALTPSLGPQYRLEDDVNRGLWVPQKLGAREV